MLLTSRNSDMIPSKLAHKVDASLSGRKKVPRAKPIFLKKEVEWGKNPQNCMLVYLFMGGGEGVASTVPNISI